MLIDEGSHNAENHTVSVPPGGATRVVRSSEKVNSPGEKSRKTVVFAALILVIWSRRRLVQQIFS